VVDKFTLSMVNPPVNIQFSKVSREEFCEAVKDGSDAIPHQETINLINILCRSGLNTNNIQIKAEVGDTVYIIRVPEQSENVLESYCKGEVVLLKAIIYKANE